MAPLWRKAPLLLFRFPGLLLPLAAAVAVLTLGSASQALFVSSAASATLEHEFSQLDANSIGLDIGTYGIPVGDTMSAAEEAVEAAGARVPRLGEPTLQLQGEDVTLGDDQARLPLLFRTGATDNLIVVEESHDGRGLWIAASVAADLGLAVGDDLPIAYGDHRVVLPIGGIYRDLADLLSISTWRAPDPLPVDHPVARYWTPLGGFIVDATPSGPSVEPPPLLADRESFATAARELFMPARMQWTFPYDINNPTLESMRAATGPLRRMEGRANDPLDPLGEALRGVHLFGGRIPVHSFLPGVSERVTATVEALAAPVRALSLAAQALALLVVAVAAAFGAQRRAVELRLLVVQGVPTAVQGAKAAVEAIVPTLVGALAGWVAAVALIRAIGPSPDLSPDVVRAALNRSLVLSAVPLLVVGIVTAAVARAQAAEGSSRLRGLAARAPWEVMVLVLAGAAYDQVATRTPDPDEVALDGLVLLFPLLLIAGGAGLVARGLARLLPRLRGSAGCSGSDAGYLARRRLAAAPGSALLLVAASSLAIGVLVYAATAAQTTSDSLTLKAAVDVGSDVAISVGRDPGFRLDFPSTRVGRQEADVLGGSADGLTVDVLAVDTTTFAEAATWSDTFSSRPLSELIALLQADGPRLPMIATGGVPSQGTLSTSRYQLPMTVAARVRAFPGMSADQPIVVVDGERLIAAVAASDTSTTDERLFLEGTQWVRGNPSEVMSALRAAAVPEDDITTVAQLRSRPDLLARSWALGYLQAVGIAGGLLAFIGTLLYLSARQASREVAYVLARRMGLTAAAHRRSVAVELAGMLGLATATGTILTIAAARLLLAQLDPLPDLAPAPVLALPLTLLLGMTAAILVACAIGAAVVQRSADRARVSEVLRLAA